MDRKAGVPLSSDNRSNPAARLQRPKLQFGLRFLMLVTLLVSVLAATWSAIVNNRQGTGRALVLVAIAGPLALMIAISLFHAALRLLAAFRERRNKPPE